MGTRWRQHENRVDGNKDVKREENLQLWTFKVEGQCMGASGTKIPVHEKE